MPLYRYLARTEQGKKLRGVVDADTLEMAKERLRRQKVFLTKIAELKNEHAVFDPSLLLSFTRELAQLLKVGLPLFESLVTLEEKYRKHKAHFLFLDLCDRLKGGSSLSSSMKHHPKIFDPVYIAMVESGEKGGLLAQIFEQLLQFQTRSMRLKKKLVSALTYPALLFGFCLCVIFLLLWFVVPQMRELFEGRTVHPMTAFILGASHFVENYSLAIFVSASVLPITCYAVMRKDAFRKKMQKFCLRLPLLKTLFMQAALSRFSRTLFFLLQSGVSLLEALRLARGSLNFAPLEEVASKAEAHIAEGGKLSHFFQTAPFLPPLVFRMIAIGEETGQLAKMFFHLADITDEELERNLEQLTTMLQPLLLILMGGVVGLVVLAVLLPLTDVGSFLN